MKPHGIPILLTGILIISGRKPPSGAASKYETTTVARGDLVQHVTASGTLSALVSVDVGSQVSGKISVLNADHNSPVKQGQLVVEIDPTIYQAARTAWHTHPLGQTLIVTAGCGWVQRWGGSIEEIHPGDMVWFPPGEKHWHGATPTTTMTHIAIQEQLDGKAVDWMETVRNEHYRR